MTAVFLESPKRLVEVTIDGQAVPRSRGRHVARRLPLAGHRHARAVLTPVSVCRVCVVEVEGSPPGRYGPAAHGLADPHRAPPGHV